MELARRSFLGAIGATFGIGAAHAEITGQSEKLTSGPTIAVEGPPDQNVRIGHHYEPVLWTVDPVTKLPAQGVTAVGPQVAGALTGKWNGSFASVFGFFAASESTGAYCLSAFGLHAARRTTAQYVSAFGAGAMMNHEDGAHFTAIGAKAALDDVNGRDSVILGSFAAPHGKSITRCVVIGDRAAYDFPFSSYNECNVMIGGDVASSMKGGRHNTIVGYKAGKTAGNFDGCTFIGSEAGVGSIDGSAGSTSLGRSSYVTGSFQIQLGAPGSTPYAWSPLQTRSDKRDKVEIEPLSIAKAAAMVLDADWKEYRFKLRNGEHEGKRRHGGVLAQDEHSRLAALGIDSSMIQHHEKTGGADVWSVAYEGYIPAIGVILQDLNSRLRRLEADNTELKATVSSLRTRLSEAAAAGTSYVG